MVCVEMPPANMDFEREEGEIVDDLDDLSDISSEEECLLRQRLEILENYNNALERKEAKRSSIGSSKTNKTNSFLWSNLSTLHDHERAPETQIYRVIKNDRHLKKPKQHKEIEIETKPLKHNKKKHTRAKKAQSHIIESSEDSNDDEYKNKRQKLLADAVTLNIKRTDCSSLKDRIARMLNPKQKSNDFIVIENTILTGSTTVPINNNNNKSCSQSIIVTRKDEDKKPQTNIIDLITVSTNNDVNPNTKVIDFINVSDDDVVKAMTDNEETHNTVVNKNQNDKCCTDSSSDEDLESLRQHALKTKTSKQHVVLPEIQNNEVNKIESEEEDSDTEELRTICLRSALLKKAIEIKKEQKLQKKLSQKSIICDDLLDKYENNGNSTDVENVDMDIGSDVDEKCKDHNDNPILEHSQINATSKGEKTFAFKLNKEDELEEDEDLLRAKLLTSLSKNLPNLVDIDNEQNTEIANKNTIVPKKDVINKISVPEKKFIIELGDSDSEVEHEATKNLTKMHLKLAEQTEFQQKLDTFLKSTRMEVEKNTLPDIIQQQVPVKLPQKIVPKAMNHLPKSEQIEYKNLVKRMAELEKIKHARQLTLNHLNKSGVKDTLKLRNISSNSLEISAKKMEENIAKSRKMIADESAKMLKLKEEATNLRQRYNIVENELRNITTAIALNKKQQRTVHNGLNKIRLQHQMLLKSSTFKHSTMLKPSAHIFCNKSSNSNHKKQKENDPLIKDHRNLKSVKVSVANDINKAPNNQIMSIEVDLSSNKKVVKMPKPKDRIIDDNENGLDSECIERDRIVEDSRNINDIHDEKDKNSDIKDYISPLEALGQTGRTRNLRKHAMSDRVDGRCVRTSRNIGAAIWKEDPNAFLCPFEVGGSCRDTDCKFLHMQKTQ